MSLPVLLDAVRNCNYCADALPLGPRPIIEIHPESRILLVAQAPARKVHETGIPWDDPSGDRLRSWLGVTREQFYDIENFAILPIGFCYPGKSASGDLPPRKECVRLWFDKIMPHLSNIQLTILIGLHAQRQFLGKRASSVTYNVKNWRQFHPEFIPLPHPSPRNNIWLTRESWFEKEVLPILKTCSTKILSK